MKEWPEGKEFTSLLLWLILHCFTRLIWIYSRLWYMLGNQQAICFSIYIFLQTQGKISFSPHMSCIVLQRIECAARKTTERTRSVMKNKIQGILSWVFQKTKKKTSGTANKNRWKTPKMMWVTSHKCSGEKNIKADEILQDFKYAWDYDYDKFRNIK